MTPDLILVPALAQILLTIVVYGALAAAKARAVKSGLVDEDRRALHDDAWPESVLQINNNIRNQFEVPVLFYVLTIILWQLNETGVLAQLLAWTFVISRVVHAYIDTDILFARASAGRWQKGRAYVDISFGGHS